MSLSINFIIWQSENIGRSLDQTMKIKIFFAIYFID